MRFDRLNLFKFGIFGGIMGGIIAMVGFWIFSPETNSVVLFVILRVMVGAVVAMIVGPMFKLRF